MTDQKLTETLRRLEIEEGFIAAFDRLWGFCSERGIPETDEFLIEEMQRWHILYGEDYERLCTVTGIDYTKFQVEDSTIM